MKVDICEKNDLGITKIIATFRIQDNEIICDNHVLWKHLMNSGGGAVIGKRGKRYFPRDGLDYLKNLKYQFAGPYLFAQISLEEEDTTTNLNQTSERSDNEVKNTSTSQEKITDTADIAKKEEVPKNYKSSINAAQQQSKFANRFLNHRYETTKLKISNQEHIEKSSGEDNRSIQENIAMYLFFILYSFRAGDIAKAKDNTSHLLAILQKLIDIDVSTTKQIYESKEEFIEIKYQTPSKNQYCKLWDKFYKIAKTVEEMIVQGDLAGVLWPLFLLQEGLKVLPNHRLEWLQTVSGKDFFTSTPYGLSKEDFENTWETLGLKMFKQQGLSQFSFQPVLELASEPYAKAISFLQNANYGESEHYLKQALIIDPGNIESRLLFGDILRKTDRLSESYIELMHALELEYLEMKNYHHSIQTAEPFLRLSRSYISMGKTLLNLGKIKESIDYLEKGLETFDTALLKTISQPNENSKAHIKEEKNSINKLLQSLYSSLSNK